MPVLFFLCVTQSVDMYTDKLKKVLPYKGNSIRLSVDFSAETLQIKRVWNDIIKVLKKKKN